MFLTIAKYFPSGEFVTRLIFPFGIISETSICLKREDFNGAGWRAGQ
jgi:hypothetical protein